MTQEPSDESILQSPDLIFYTEQYPPFNYEENGTLKGISVDLLEAVTERLGKPVSRNQIRVVPWTEAYQAGLTEDKTVIFTAGRIPQRESHFKWAGPIYTNHHVLFARPDKNITIAGPQDLQKYRIGVIADDITIAQLQDLGINRSLLVEETDVSTLIDLLKRGEIDLWGYSEKTGRYFSHQKTGDYYAFDIVYTLSTLDGYYAFSRDIPDATVSAFQEALDSLKTDKDATGITPYEQIIRRYIPPAEPQPLVMTPDDLAAFVKNAAGYATSVGKQSALAEFQRMDGPFTQRNLYIYAYDYDCLLLAHPYEPGLVGTDRSTWTDVRGVPVIRIGAHVSSRGGGFIAYLYPAPEKGVIDEKARGTYQPKIGYVYPVEDTWWIGSGIYFSDLTTEASGRPKVVSDMIRLVEESAKYGRAEGKAAAFAEISNPSGRFVDAEGHYIYAYDYRAPFLHIPIYRR
jgi:ABC-type amino acid transport/signal transduction systems, periplasmic component/domain